MWKFIPMVLVLACSHGGATSKPTCPPSPPPPPCLTRKPPGPPPSLVKNPEDTDLLWAYVELLENRVRLDWTLCGPQENDDDSRSSTDHHP